MRRVLDGREGEGRAERVGNVRVYVVDADYLVLDEEFSLFWRRDWEVGPVLQHLDTASLLNENAFHGLRD